MGIPTTISALPKTKGREKETGRHRQGMDRTGVLLVQEGSGKQIQPEETGCDLVICGAPTTCPRG